MTPIVFLLVRAKLFIYSLLVPMNHWTINMNDKLLISFGFLLQLIVTIVTLTWNLSELKTNFTIQLLELSNSVQLKMGQLSSEISVVRDRTDSYQVQQKESENRIMTELTEDIRKNTSDILALQENCTEIQKRHAIEDAQGGIQK